MRELIDKLRQTQVLAKEEWIKLIDGHSEASAQYLFAQARQVRCKIYGQDVYIRGLIEISNYCKNDCYYCGIRKSNKNAVRYRLMPEEILACVQNGYTLGFRTFVLQGGDDAFYTDELLAALILQIKKTHPDCAVTLSLGERSRESYRYLFSAGADRYLLRHETASQSHYAMLHPAGAQPCKAQRMSVSVKRNRLPDRKWFHGWFPRADSRRACRGSVIFKRFESADGRHWTLYPAS